jgi:hypothetical protein
MGHVACLRNKHFGHGTSREFLGDADRDGRLNSKQMLQEILWYKGLDWIKIS